MLHLSDNELINYISGKLSDDWNKRIEHHLATCNECRETAFFLQEMNNEWENPSNNTILDFTDHVMNQIQTEIPLQEIKDFPSKIVEIQKVKPNKNLKYLHFGLAAAAMILFSQVGLGDLVKEKTVTFVNSSSKKMNQATVSFTKGVQTVNKLTEKQLNKMEDLKYEKTK
ncbi:MAG: hypothetical protein K0R71_893 [Bacillales bacterium]|jgi:hypothetical protein|nr:hypothetical protein [Bacillales bacterium]